MTKRIETRKIDDNKPAALETIETVALDDVTGGCAACGCGQPDPAGVQQQQLAQRWARR
jgi:hypothetical protein